jgi:histidyl-tRNA synthetase
MVNQPQPAKLFYWGPFFRHDRPQAGRYRQFYQFGFEVLGEAHPIIDAQLILLAFILYKELGINVTMQVNSIGCMTCREEYKKVLFEYYKSRKNALCENCKKRLLKNPLRLLDCKETDCRELSQEAPQMVDHLCEECRNHFVRVLEYLDELEITYVLNPKIVRGLDYYTKTTFEIWTSEEDGSQALGGGGRYDVLVEQLGGRPTPAAGFASGIERLIIKMRDKGVAPKEDKNPEIFIAQLGDLARKKCLKLFEEIRKAGILVAESFSKDGIKPQLEIADKLGAKIALILGQKEIMDETIIFRDMENGIQENVDFKKTIQEIKKRLEKIYREKQINNINNNQQS